MIIISLLLGLALAISGVMLYHKHHRIAGGLLIFIGGSLVGFGVIFLIIGCAVFTTLSRYPRRPRPTAVPRTVRRPTQSRLPFPPR